MKNEGVPLNLRTKPLTGFGLDSLRTALVALAESFTPADDDAVAINARHAHALSQARELLTDAGEKLSVMEPMELVSSDLRGALASLGEITGRIDNERMLDQLFATFCIGK